MKEGREEGGNIVSLNVGGAGFATSRSTLMKEPFSMLGRMFSSGELKNHKDTKGRIFVDRDPTHFRVILNYLRDGACVVPTEETEIAELLKEIDFYQLEGMKAFVEDWPHSSAHHLRVGIACRIKGDPRLQEILDLLVGCAFGSGEKRSLYPRKGFVELVVRENAFNPLFPQPAQSTYAKDETIFVAFNQLLTLKGKMESHSFVGKHEPAFIHEEGQLSYDPTVYSSSYQDRFHIKTLDVYRHHCLHQLSEEHRTLRNAILYIEQQSDAVQWLLEVNGFQNVRIVFHAREPELWEVLDSPPTSPTGQDSQNSPLLCNIRMDIHFSL